jgi:hypothetical protein
LRTVLLAAFLELALIFKVLRIFAAVAFLATCTLFVRFVVDFVVLLDLEVDLDEDFF